MTNADLSPNHTNEPKEERGAHLRPVYNFQNKQPLRLVVPEGQLQVHTAPFRGSFSVVLSEALRAAGLGRKVMIAQFLKGGVNQGPEGTVRLCGRLEWLRPNIPSCLPVPQSEQDADLSGNSTQAVKAVWQTCKERLLIGGLDQLVLDEVGLAITHGYLNEDELVSTLERRPETIDVILTGPSIPSSVLSMADQVTKLRCYV